MKSAVKTVNSPLKDKLESLMPRPATIENYIVKGFGIFRRDADTLPTNCFYKPSVAFILQGEKTAVIGREKFVCKVGQIMIAGTDVPSRFSLKASKRRPFLSLSLDLDGEIFSEFISQMPARNTEYLNVRGVAVSNASPEIFDAFLRLLNTPQNRPETPLLASITIREIHLLLLTSSIGEHIYSLYTMGSCGNRILKTISWMKKNLASPIKIGELLKLSSMSESTFHRYFKRITNTTPIQFPKNLRLNEARRLLISKLESVSGAAYAVGYESPSQFSRDYKRLFGKTPAEDK